MSMKLTEIYPNVPAAVAGTFGMPPLIGDEKVEVYSAFFALFAAEKQPRNIMQWLHLKDMVDHSWNIQREHGIKAQVICNANAKLLESPSLTNKDAGPYYRIPQAYINNQKSIDAFDHRITQNEIRRNLSFREFERHAASRPTSMNEVPPLAGEVAPFVDDKLSIAGE